MTNPSPLRHIPAARTEVAEEKHELRAEQDAFSDFGKRVNSLEPVRESTTVGSTVQQCPTLIASDHRPGDLTRVRQAYRETVMSVAHYSEEYGESLQTNMAQEFSPELAQAVDSDQPLTQRLKQTLIAASNEAHQDREPVIKKLDEEQATLENAETQLRDLEGRRADLFNKPPVKLSYDELLTIHEELDTLCDEVNKLCKQRQSLIHTRQIRIPGTKDKLSFCEYIYQGLEVTHPVLSEAVLFLERTQQNSRQIRWHLSRID